MSWIRAIELWEEGVGEGLLILTSDKFMDKPFTCVVLMVQVCVYVFYCLKNSFADYATLVTGSTSVKEFLVPVISVVLVITGLASIRVIIIAWVLPTVVVIITFHAVLVGVIRAFMRVVGVIIIIKRIIKVIWIVIVLILCSVWHDVGVLIQRSDSGSLQAWRHCHWVLLPGVLGRSLVAVLCSGLWSGGFRFLKWVVPLDGVGVLCAVLPGFWTRESTSHSSICATTLSIASSATTSPVVGGYLGGCISVWRVSPPTSRGTGLM